MQAKFTKRSEKDATRVTVSLAQFDGTELDCGRVGLPGSEVILVVDGVPTLFIFARPDSDGLPTVATTYCFPRHLLPVATTYCFPRHLLLPGVGQPVYAEVTEIR